MLGGAAEFQGATYPGDEVYGVGNRYVDIYLPEKKAVASGNILSAGLGVLRDLIECPWNLLRPAGRLC